VTLEDDFSDPTSLLYCRYCGDTNLRLDFVPTCDTDVLECPCGAPCNLSDVRIMTPITPDGGVALLTLEELAVSHGGHLNTRKVSQQVRDQLVYLTTEAFVKLTPPAHCPEATHIIRLTTKGRRVAGFLRAIQAEHSRKEDIHTQAAFKQEHRGNQLTIHSYRMPAYPYTPANPIRDVLRLLSRGKEPPKYVIGYSTHVPDGCTLPLQDWAASNAGVGWMTGIGLLDAADLLVASAVGNANIPPEPPSSDPVLFIPPGYPAGDGTDLECGWYFSDETWTTLLGPHPTEAAARVALTKYAETL